MKSDDKLDLRIPAELRSALEREQRRMSKAVGTDMKMSAVVRAILERALRNRRRTEARAAR